MFLTTVRMEDKAGNAVSLDFTVRPAIYSWLFEKVVKMLFEASTQDFTMQQVMVWWIGPSFIYSLCWKLPLEPFSNVYIFLKIAQE